MGRKGTGVELRDRSIRVGFKLGADWVRETLDILPTTANEKYAARKVALINQQIKDGTFVYVEHFPNSKRAPKTAEAQTFGEMGELWLQTKGRLATKTLAQYRNAVAVWCALLGTHTPFSKLTHAVVAAKVGSHPWASAKLLNNYMICLRGIFNLARRDLKIDNPMDGIENSKHQTAQPDPFSKVEMELILAQMASSYGVLLSSYFTVAFLSGMRPEELIALRWADMDWIGRSLHVSRARSAGEIKPLKTYNARDVELVERAVQALERIKPLTIEGNGGYIFQNPNTSRPWHDDRSQRDHFWKPALTACGVRYRTSYQTRHTYATLGLAAGVNPTWVSRQMGHKNAKMLFTVYAKWIDGADRGREKAKMEAMLLQ